MRPVHRPVYVNWPFALAVSRVFDVPPTILGLLPLRDGRPRSRHRHRNRGRV